MQQTSIINYIELKESGKLGRRQELVYSALNQLGQATDMELAKFMGFDDPNRSKPRRNELVKLGLVTELGKRSCKITGKTAIVWKAV